VGLQLLADVGEAVAMKLEILMIRPLVIGRIDGHQAAGAADFSGRLGGGRQPIQIDPKRLLLRVDADRQLKSPHADLRAVDEPTGVRHAVILHPCGEFVDVYVDPPKPIRQG